MKIRQTNRLLVYSLLSHLPIYPRSRFRLVVVMLISFDRRVVYHWFESVYNGI